MLDFIRLHKLRNHDFYDYDIKSKGRHYDLPSVSVRSQRVVRAVGRFGDRSLRRTKFGGEYLLLVLYENQQLTVFHFPFGLLTLYKNYSDDVSRAAADSFRLQVRRRRNATYPW